jgi:hypothetical protein
LYDSTEGAVDIEIAGPTLELRTADELGAEVEEFLRDQE